MSNKKLKIITIVGTRPEIIRLSCIIKELDKNFQHILINTNQNFDINLNQIFFSQLGLKKPNYNLKCKTSSTAIFLSDLFSKIDKLFIRENPDAILVLGDTNSSLSTIVAKKRKIPIFHIEAGNRCFDQRVPEEINRKIVDHISDINLTYSDYASQNLVLEGIPKDRIIKIGSPMLEVLNLNQKKINSSPIIKKLNLQKNKYILASIHRDENIEDQEILNEILESILYFEKKYNMPVVFSTHPRTKKKIVNNIKKYQKNIIFHKPFGYFEFVNLMMNAKFILSDSGSISEETSILSLPSVNLRNSNERQESMEKGTVIMSGTKKNDIINAVNIMLNNDKKINIHSDYSNKHVSLTVVKIIQSYTHYIMNKTWNKK